MEYEVEIPQEFSDMIASSVQTRSGAQERPYGPHVYSFRIVTATKDVPEETVLRFAQERCLKCHHSSEEYNALLNKYKDDFHSYMCTVADGRYTLRKVDDGAERPGSTWVYEVVEDYID